MKFYFKFLIIFIASSISFSAPSAKERKPNVYQACAKEVSLMCKGKKIELGINLRECLKKEISFISIKCEDELDYFEKYYK